MNFTELCVGNKKTYKEIGEMVHGIYYQQFFFFKKKALRNQTHPILTKILYTYKISIII